MKEYTKPIIKEEEIQLEDVIATSGSKTGAFGNVFAGDFEDDTFFD